MSERGSGRTTRQLKDLPQDAYFVCAHRSHADYTRNLARLLGRDDVRILTVAECLNHHRFAGLRNFNFNVDHATDEILYRGASRETNGRWYRAFDAMVYYANRHAIEA